MADDQTAALVVALEAQLTKFEKAMADAPKIADRSVKAIESKFDQLNSLLGTKFDNLTRGFQSNLGTMGTALGILGPAGFAAAVGIGAIVSAFNYASEAADKLATKAKGIRESARDTGLTTRQFQALAAAGGKVGLSAEELDTAFSRFTVNLNQLKQGSGELLEQILKISPALAKELAVAGTTADAINLLGQAYKNLSVFQANALSKAIGGKSAVGLSQLLPGFNLTEATAEFDAAGKGIQDGMINTLIELQRQIKASKAAYDTTIAKMFAEDVLRSELQYAQQWERIAKIIAGVDVGVLDKLKAVFAEAFSGGEKVEGPLYTLTKKVVQSFQEIPPAVEEAKTATTNYFGENSKVVTEATTKVKTFADRWEEVQPAVKKTTDELKTLHTTGQSVDIVKPAETAASVYRRLKDEVEALGDAATPVQKLALEQARLAAAREANISLGPNLIKQEQQYRRAMEETRVAILERLGIATQEEMQAVATAKVRKDLTDAGVKDEARIAEATRVSTNATRERFEAEKARASALPGLTRLTFDYANTNKQLDQLLTSTFSATENAFADFVTGAKTGKEAFKDFANSVIRDLSKLLIRQSLLAPLASFLGGSSGSGGILSGLTARAGGGPVTAGRGYIVGENGPEYFKPRSSGSIIPNHDLSSPIRSSGSGGSYTGGNIVMNIAQADSGGIMAIEARLIAYQRDFASNVARSVRQLQSNRVPGFR